MLMHTDGYVEVLAVGHATQEEALGYLDTAIDLIKRVDEWDVDAELQMFLDQRSIPISEYNTPKEFIEFHDFWLGELHHASVDAGFAEHVDYRRIRAMARALATSFTRRGYYLEFLQDRRKGILEGKDYKLPSFHELELRYQYHLYALDHDDVGVPVDKTFKEWCDTDECRTFFDVMELQPKND